MNTYSIHVTTSSQRFAGTNANVFIQLIGDYSSSDKIQLKNSKTNSKDFEQGQTDLFQIKCDDVGQLKKIRIGHDGRGIGAGWHLKEILVESQANGVKWLCECNRWLDKFEDDGKIERELNATEQPRSRRKWQNNDQLEKPGSMENTSYRSQNKSIPQQSINRWNERGRFDIENLNNQTLGEKYLEDQSMPNKIIYKIFVTTSDLRFAGTDANVYVSIHGKRLNTGNIKLKSSRMNMNMFEQGKTDFFEVRGVDVGEIEMLR